MGIMATEPSTRRNVDASSPQVFGSACRRLLLCSNLVAKTPQSEACLLSYNIGRRFRREPGGMQLQSASHGHDDSVMLSSCTMPYRLRKVLEIRLKQMRVPWGPVRSLMLVAEQLSVTCSVLPGFDVYPGDLRA